MNMNDAHHDADYWSNYKVNYTFFISKVTSVSRPRASPYPHPKPNASTYTLRILPSHPYLKRVPILTGAEDLQIITPGAASKVDAATRLHAEKSMTMIIG
jgi:hypothetical protein